MAGALAALGAMAGERPADACGACFVGASESTVVSDHRMALAFSKRETILWDQIRYQGDPKEFAYVIPARPGTRIELSHEAWFAALDAATRPIIMTPSSGYPGGGAGGGYPNGGGYGGGRNGASDNSPGYASTGGGGGCCTSMTALSAEAFAGDPDQYGPMNAGSAGNADGGAGAKADPVEIVQQQVIGPYETVTLRSDDPEALSKWLAANGFNLPDEAKPILADYVADGLDFIAMRLRPTTGVRAMEPIRIVTQGADVTLPLRMMRIGAGQKLGITLFVLGEGRYRPKNFPHAVVDASQLLWDYNQKRSNYQNLSAELMAKDDGKTWLTEYANRPDLNPRSPLPGSGMVSNPGLATAYVTSCPASLPYVPIDAGVIFGRDSGPDGSASDAGADASTTDGGAFDAGGDAAADASPPPPPKPRTKRCDDLDVAIAYMAQADVWLTRMRAFLPNASMETPLELEPDPSQTPVENVHYATTFGTVAGLRAPDAGERGTFAMVLAACAGLWTLMRRRRR
jgi:hypothetical protein